MAVEFDADSDDFAAHKIEHEVSKKRSLVSFLPQDERLYHFFGNALDMFNPDAPKDFFVKIYYEDMGGGSHENRFRASVADLEGFRRVGEMPEHTAAEALKAIREDIRHWSSGFNRLKVEVITALEQEEKNKNIREAHMNRGKHHADGDRAAE